MSTAAPTRPAPWTFAAPWGARGNVSDLDGPVHWIEFAPGTARMTPDRQVAGQFLLYALPGLGELYVRVVTSRRPPAQAVQRVNERCFADPSRHTPQLEVPHIVIGTVQDWLGRTTPGTR
jgi:hypothetical protein